MKTFDEYWEQYGELHASMCGGDIKQFAKEIWESAVAEERRKIRLKMRITNLMEFKKEVR